MTIRLHISLLVLVSFACGKPARPALPGLVTITTRNFAFEAPDTLRSGPTTIRMVNAGPSRHHVQLYRLPEGRSIAEALAALPSSEPLPSWFVPVGGPEGAHDLTRESVVTLNLDPGLYLLACRFATSGVLHFAKGMVRPLVVVRNERPDTIDLPEPDVTVTLYDYGFEVSGPIRAGRRLIRVVNQGPHEHQLSLARLADGKGLADVIADYATEADDHVYDVLGGTAGLAPGTSNIVEFDLASGPHVLLCVVPDPKTGRDHVQYGMLKEVIVE
jgi:hypothetical protein